MTQTEKDIIAGLQEALDLSPFMREVMESAAKCGITNVRITIKDGMPDYEVLENEEVLK